MPSETEVKSELCNCLVLRQAARRVTQFYDAFLLPAGLRTSQFSILAKLRWRGSLTITALAVAMLMDRTTLSRNLRPLHREGLVSVALGGRDHRSKELRLTEAGRERLRAAMAAWNEAQRRFDGVFGAERAAGLRDLLQLVSASDLSRADEMG